MDSKTKGYLYVVLARFFWFGWPIFAVLAMQYQNYLTTSVLWFGSASVFSFLFILFAGNLSEFRKFKKYWRYIVFGNLIMAITIVTSFKALSLLGPALTGFVGKINVLLVVIAGVVVLKERFNIYEAISSALILAGVLIVAFTKGEFIIEGIILLVISGIGLAIWRVIIKSKLDKIKPMVNVHFRAVFVTVFILVYALIVGQFEIEMNRGLIYATFPSIFSAVLNHYFTFKAYRYIDMSKVALVGSFAPILLAFMTYFIFGEVLSINQWIGGLLTITGVVGLVYYRK